MQLAIRDISRVMYEEYSFPIFANHQGSVLGWTVPKTRFKPAFYCPKLSKTAQNRPKLSETANWLQKCQIDTWPDIKFAKFKLSNAWKN